jgi:diacylglycerol kinase family enzyme
VRRIQTLLSRRGATLEILVTRAAGDAKRLAAELSPDFEAVEVAGGDGTVGEVINGLAPSFPAPTSLLSGSTEGGRGREKSSERLSSLPLLLFRSGTENLAARELKTPVDPDRVIETLLCGRPRSCDLGEINGRRFLAICGIGFDAECVLRMSTTRRGHITHADYFWPIWRAFWSYSFPGMRFEVDGATVFEGRGLALISNIPRYSIGMNLLWKARTDDALLDLGIFPCSTRSALVAHAARAICNLHEKHEKMLYYQARSIRITSPHPVPIEIDGEIGGALPAVCNILPNALAVLAAPLRCPLDTAREPETIG